MVELLEQAYDLIRAHGRSFTAATSVNLRVQRGEAVIDLAVGPIAAHTPEELEAPGGHHTPVYRQR